MGSIDAIGGAILLSVGARNRAKSGPRSLGNGRCKAGVHG
jgi:hypothetical protein